MEPDGEGYITNPTEAPKKEELAPHRGTVFLDKYLTGKTPEQREAFSGMVNVGSIMGTLIDAKPATVINPELADNLLKSMRATDRDLARNFAVMPTKSGKALFINRAKLAEIFAKYPQYFSQVGGISEMLILAAEFFREQANEEPEGEKQQVRTGLILGIPLEDCLKFAKLYPQAYKISKYLASTDQEGNPLQKLGFTSGEIQLLDKVDSGEFTLNPIIRSQIQQTLRKIPGLDEEIINLYSQKRIYQAKGISWVGYGPLVERSERIKSIEQKFEESGMNKLAEKYNIPLPSSY